MIRKADSRITNKNRNESSQPKAKSNKNGVNRMTK